MQSKPSLLCLVALSVSIGCEGGGGGAPIGVYRVIEASADSPYAEGTVLKVGLREVAAPDFPSSYLTLGSCDSVQECAEPLPWTFTFPEKDPEGTWLGRFLNLHNDGTGSIRLVATDEQGATLLRAEYRDQLAGGRTIVACDTESYETSGRSYMERYCLDCHSTSLEAAERQGAPFGVDFDTLDLIRPQQDRVHARVADGTMPTMTGSEAIPTAAESTELLNWLECGIESLSP